MPGFVWFPPGASPALTGCSLGARYTVLNAFFSQGTMCISSFFFLENSPSCGGLKQPHVFIVCLLSASHFAQIIPSSLWGKSGSVLFIHGKTEAERLLVQKHTTNTSRTRWADPRATSQPLNSASNPKTTHSVSSHFPLEARDFAISWCPLSRHEQGFILPGMYQRQILQNTRGGVGKGGALLVTLIHSLLKTRDNAAVVC